MHKTKLRILPSGPPACLSRNTTLEEQVFVKTPSCDRLYEDYIIRPISFHDMYTCAFSDVSVLVCGIEMRARGLWKCLERQQPVASRATPHPHTLPPPHPPHPPNHHPPLFIGPMCTCGALYVAIHQNYIDAALSLVSFPKSKG